MKKWIALVLLGGFMSPLISSAIDLKQSKFTQVVNNVEIISAADQTLHAAAVNDIFTMPDMLRTGPDSRAELEATDGTITRVGANTIFSFDPASRTIDLQQGSLLFHSPHGKGGGTIHTGSATASVIGTTIIVTSTPNGGFKLLDLEGQAEVRFLNGVKQTLEPGQMTFILPGGSVSPIVVFRLDTETKGSALVGGFNTPLDSQSKINSEITHQLLQILNGTAADTGYVVGNNATVNSVQVIVDNINNTPQPSTTPPSTTPTPPAGFATDGRIVGSDGISGLPMHYPPLDPIHVVTSPFLIPSGIESFSEGLSLLGIAGPASGFVADNIDIDTANVDLSSFAGNSDTPNSDFDFMASGNMRIWQSVDFSGDTLPNTIALFAGGDLSIAPNSTLEADTGVFALVADSFSTLDTEDGSIEVPNTLENITIINNVGDVDVLSLQDLGIYDSEIDAGGNVEIVSDGNLNLGELDDDSIHAGGNVTLFAGLFSGGTLDVENTEIYAGDSENGGSMNLNAGGDINIDYSDLYADSGPVGLGNVNIDGGGKVDIEDTNISAGGDVSIESGDTLYLGWYDSAYNSISARGSVDLTSDNSDVDIDDYEIYTYGSDENGNGINISAGGNVDFEDSSEVYAYGGGISITGSGSVYLYNDDIEAGEDTESLYDLDITSDGSTVDIDDTYLYADGGVNIESGDTLTVEDSSEIEAGSGDASLTSDNSDVDIYASEVNAGGDVNISGYTGVDIEDSSVMAGYESDSGGSITVNAYSGNVFISDSTLSASDDDEDYGGEVTITAGGNIDIESSRIDADGLVTVNAGGYIKVHDSLNSPDLHMDDSFLDAGIYVDLSADGNLDISGDTTIYADDGKVSIVSDGTSGGSIDISGDNTIEASGKVCITDEGTISLSSADISSSDFNIGVDSSDIYADSGDLTITGDGAVDFDSEDTISIDDSSFSANNISIADDSTLYASDTASILDNGTFSISGNDVSISDSSDLEVNNISLAGSALTADYGDASIVNNGDISISGGATASVSIDDTTINANNISISGSLTAYDGDVSIVDNGTVSISAGTVDITDSSDLEVNNIYIADTSLTADGGDVTITDNGQVSISGDESVLISSDSDFSPTISANNISILIPDPPIYAAGGISIVDNGIVSISSANIFNYDLELNNISVGSYDLTADDGDISIVDNGSISISGADNAATISGSTLSANNITIASSTFTANGGDVDVYDYGQVVGAPDISESDVSANNILIDSSYLYAYASQEDVGGNVNISGNGAVELDYSTIYADNNVNITAEQAKLDDAIYDSSGGVTVSGGSITAGKNLVITANGAAGTTINNGATLNAFYITVNSPDGILINQDGSSSTYTGNQLNLTAGNSLGQDIMVKNADFSSFQNIAISAYTLYFDGANLGYGIVNLGSHDGRVFVNQGYQRGSLDFDNSYYGGNLITSPNQVAHGIGSTPGLYSHAN